MIIAWVSSGMRMIATERDRFDPGTGPDRYQRARRWLEESGEEYAMAAFTFDPEEPGSIVITADRNITQMSGRAPFTPRVDDGRAAWDEGYDRATEAISAGRVEKVVLARRVECEFDGPVDPVGVFTFLSHDNPGTYLFLIDGLVGASPELLVGVDDGRVESLALAGTADSRRGLHGSKIEREHRHTADSVESALRRHVHRIRSGRSVEQFGEIVHAATRFEGLLNQGSGILDVLAALHPTAAVAGTPRDAAIELIRYLEQPRGRYGGPVGWFDIRGNGEFAIALRCGQIDGNRVVLHAGGGLVAGSDRDLEWAETELKLGPMGSALDFEG